jgi:hypothetical protein
MWSDVTAWLKSPFNSSGSAFNWVLFVGLLLIAAWMWNTVLLHFSGDI